MKNSMTPSIMSLAVLALMASLAVTGCGGGSSSDSSTPTTQEPGKLMLSGVVTTQTVQAQAAVVAKCAVGGGNVTTAADGSYSLSLDKALLPCVLEADLFDGSRLHSVAYGASGATTATSNITPVTELVVANVSGTDPTAYYTNFSSTNANGLTTSKIDSSTSTVTVMLKNSGVDLSAVGNPVTSVVSTATYTQALALLDTTMVSTGTTLIEFTATVAAGSPNTTSSTASAASMLPASLLLKPKANTCDSLRSGTYRIFKFTNSSVTGDTSPVDTIGTAIFDAAGLTYTTAGGVYGGSAGTLTPHATDKCRFITTKNDDIVISPTGVMVGLSPVVSNGITTYQIFFGLPLVQENSITLADLAGRWDMNSWGSYQGVIDIFSVNFNLDAGGHMIRASCTRPSDTISTPESNCTTATAASTLIPLFVQTNPAGGFDLINPGKSLDTLFAYRSGNGRLSMVGLNSTGDFDFINPYQSDVLPTVGSTSSYWVFGVDNTQKTSDPIFSVSTHVDSILSATSFIQTLTNNGDPNTARSVVMDINTARAGYTHQRPATGVPTAGGSLVNVNESYSLKMDALGLMTVYMPATLTSPASFAIVVQQP